MQDFGAVDPEILSEFIVEAKEHLAAIEPTLLELENDPANRELMDTIFRPMHSIKGAASFIGLTDIAGLTHKFESLLDELRKGRRTADREVVDLLFAATDLTVKLIDNLSQEPDDREDYRPEMEVLIGRAEAVLSGGSAAAAPERPAVGGADAGQAAERLADFLDEARAIQNALAADLVRLEAAPEPDLVTAVFRGFAELGAKAAHLGYNRLEELSRRAQAVLDDLRTGALAPEPEAVAALMEAVDTVEVLLGRISPQGIEPADVSAVLDRLDGVRAGGGEPAAAEEEPPSTAAVVETMDRLLDQIGDALAVLTRNPQDGTAIKDLNQALSDLHFEAGRAGYPEIEQKAAHRLAVASRAERGRVEIKDKVLDEFFTAYLDLTRMVDAVRSGKVRAARPEPEPKVKAEDRLMGEILIENRAATPDQVQAALMTQDAGRRPLGQILTQAGLVPPDAVEEGLRIQDKGRRPLGQILVEDQQVEPAAVEAAARRQKRPTAAVAETIRVEHAKLDSLMNLIGELIINRNRFAMILKMIAEGEDLPEIAAQLAETTTALGRISDELQDTIMKVRMVPVKSVFNRMQRLVRDLTGQSGKKIALRIEGEETELDKTVIEEIADPLVHLIRNSVDHGLEGPADREAAGKPATGVINLRAYHKGNTVVIEVEDDGRGLDPDLLRRKAVEKGLLGEEAAYALEDREALELIFTPGFSTAEQVSNISGRGVGMDVVRSNIRKLKGQVFIDSEPGRMTRLSLTLPLTLAIIDALTVIVDGMLYAIPLEAVQETLKVDRASVSSVDRRRAINLRGDVLSVVDLAQLIETSDKARRRDKLPIVIIGDETRRLGLVVDEMLERQEIVIKSLGQFLGEIQGLSGATITGDGQVVLILDPNELIRLAQQVDIAVESAEASPETTEAPPLPPASPAPPPDSVGAA
jgi:two-component system chemotaxis sensor kinase CheA